MPINNSTENRSKKPIHIVFQVLNFLHSDHHFAVITCSNMHRLLINLASHHGPRGICPSVSLITKELKLGESTIRRLIQKWKSLNIIEIEENPGKSNGYILHIPEPTHDTSDTPLTTETPLISERTPLSPVSGTPLTSEHIYNKGTTKEVTKKSSYMQKAENAKKHDFAKSMDQMANEKRHIEENEKYKKEGMADEVKEFISAKPETRDYYLNVIQETLRRTKGK